MNKETGTHTGTSKQVLATKVTKDYTERYSNKVRLKNWTRNILTFKMEGFELCGKRVEMVILM